MSKHTLAVVAQLYYLKYHNTSTQAHLLDCIITLLTTHCITTTITHPHFHYISPSPPIGITTNTAAGPASSCLLAACAHPHHPHLLSVAFTPLRDAEGPSAHGHGLGDAQGARASVASVLEGCVPLVVTRARTQVLWGRPIPIRLDEVLQASHLNARLVPMLAAQGQGLGPGLGSAQGQGLGTDARGPGLSNALITYWITTTTGTTTVMATDGDSHASRNATACSALPGGWRMEPPPPTHTLSSRPVPYIPYVNYQPSCQQMTLNLIYPPPTPIPTPILYCHPGVTRFQEAGIHTLRAVFDPTGW